MFLIGGLRNVTVSVGANTKQLADFESEVFLENANVLLTKTSDVAYANEEFLTSGLTYPVGV